MKDTETRVERGPAVVAEPFAIGMAKLLEREGKTVAAAELRRLHAQRDALLGAYRKMRNVAAGYSNCCDDSGTTRRLEREFEEADSIARAAIAAVEGEKE